MADAPGGGLAECTDIWAYPVTLTLSRADHIRSGHPEIGSFLPRVCDVLSEPNLVYLRPRVGSYLFYRLGILAGRLAGAYMVVVVRYNESGGSGRTFYATTRPATGDSLVYMDPRKGRR